MEKYTQITLIVIILVSQVFSQNYKSYDQHVPDAQKTRQSSFSPEQNRYNSGRNAKQVRSDKPVITSTSCPEGDGRYPTRTCDGYLECTDGIAIEKLCPDGLVFNAAAARQAFPCQYPIDVDCTGREQTQQPQATDDCPHQFGYYRMGDANNCGQFKNCVDGRGYIFDCPEGLAFNDATYRCDWPDQVDTCDAERFLGFSCPLKSQTGRSEDATGGFRYFRSPSDCQRYYICIKGRPRLYNCGDGNAFNELTSTCDGIENVTSCALSPSIQYTQTSYQHQLK